MEAESIMFQIVFSDEAQSGVTIQCHLSPEISADDVEIRWFKETECVCFYKNRRFIEGIGYEGRVSLCNEELKRGNVSFQLKESDDGDYLCQVISGNRREEKTVNKSLKPTTRTVWTEQPGKKWTEKERMDMANSALSAVFQSLENIVAQTEKNRLQKDLQDIKATVLKTSREMEEEQKQTELKPTQQEDESGEMSENMEISASEPEEHKITHLDNQQSETEKDRPQDAQGNVVPQTSRVIEEKPNQIEEKATQQEDESAQMCGFEEISPMEISACKLEEQKITHLENQQSGPGQTSTQSNEGRGIPTTAVQNPEQMFTQANKNEDEPQQSAEKKQKKENNKPRTILFPEEIKVFSISDGKTNECKMQFIDTLQTRIENLKEVSTEEESDIILNFCPIVSRAGTDIDAALKKFEYSTESKLNVLVVLHHTFDPEKTVLDSSRSVNREDTLTVDLLFYEDTGLLECQKNSDAYDKVVNWLIQQGKEKGIPISPFQNTLFGFSRPSWFTLGNKPEPAKQNMQQMKSTSSHSVKYFLSVTGDAQKHHMHFINTLKKQISLMEVFTEKDSDVIFLFCPEITEYHSSKEKPIILISLHDIRKPGSVSNISTFEKRQQLIPVNFIFLEDKGLLDCKINQKEISEVLKSLQPRRDL